VIAYPEATAVHVTSAYDSNSGSDIYVRVSGLLAHQIHELARQHDHNILRHCLETELHNGLCGYVLQQHQMADDLAAGINRAGIDRLPIVRHDAQL
jgi:hypothetical protein